MKAKIIQIDKTDGQRTIILGDDPDVDSIYKVYSNDTVDDLLNSGLLEEVLNYIFPRNISRRIIRRLMNRGDL